MRKLVALLKFGSPQDGSTSKNQMARTSNDALLTPHRAGAVTLDAELFAHNVDVQPFPIQHELQNHPLLQLDKLAELATRLPPHKREYVFAKHEFGAHDNLKQYEHAANSDDISTAEMIRNIAEQRTVIVLRNVEEDPQYSGIVNECLDLLSHSVEPAAGPMSRRESFIFISPPRAYTPYHWDPEQNFFMQLRGQKQMAIYDVNDRKVLTEEALDKYYNEGQLITRCDEQHFNSYTLFEMGPGDGVYVPVTAPHWVRTLDEVSVSVSVNFRTPSSIRRSRVYRVNRLLRRLGRTPAPVSQHANRWSEKAKAGLLSLPARLRRLT